MTFAYYRYISTYPREPRSWMDLFDGIRADNALREIIGLAWEK